jgi:membrane associated rhomboid family serine protease
MFIPVYSDAAKYFWPIGTGILVLLNIIVFVLDLSFDLDDYSLEYGSGLHPVQWLTSMFIHANIIHLIGNLLFIWAFGLVIEGRVGTLYFLALYLGMGIGESMLEQILLLSIGEGSSVGASSAIYALILVAMVWSPQDNITIAYWLFLTMFGTFEIPILVLGAIYLGLDGFQVLTSDSIVTTGFLHLLGATVGFVTGTVLLFTKMVNTENRDLWSMTQEARGKKLPDAPAIKTKQQKREEAALIETIKKENEIRWKSVDFHLAGENAKAAAMCFRHLQQTQPDLEWDEARLLKMISIFQKQDNADQTILYSKKYLELFSGKAATVGLNAARLLLVKKTAPRKALEMLRIIDCHIHTGHERELATKIQQAALRKIDEGEIELQ